MSKRKEKAKTRREAWEWEARKAKKAGKNEKAQKKKKKNSFFIHNVSTTYCVYIQYFWEYRPHILIIKNACIMKSGPVRKFFPTHNIKASFKLWLWVLYSWRSRTWRRIICVVCRCEVSGGK